MPLDGQGAIMLYMTGAYGTKVYRENAELVTEHGEKVHIDHGYDIPRIVWDNNNWEDVVEYHIPQEQIDYVDGCASAIRDMLLSTTGMEQEAWFQYAHHEGYSTCRVCLDVYSSGTCYCDIAG